jgi:hypothetical protein
MKLPDAEGFIIAAQKMLEDHDITYLHDAEGSPVGAVVSMQVVKRATPGPRGHEKSFVHDRLEPEQGDEVPWAIEDPPPPTPIPPDYWESAK